MCACRSGWAQQPQGTEFTARLVDGDPVRGRLLAIDDAWRISLQKDRRITLDGSQLVSLRREGRPIAPGPSGSQVLLANGDRIRAIAHRATQETLLVNSELLGDVTISLERVVALALNPPADRAARERFCQQLAARDRKHDTVMLANGDELTGSLVGLDDSHVRFEGPQGRVDIQRSGVRGIAMSSELVSFPKPEGFYAELLLADGSQVSLLSGRLEGTNLRGKAALGPDISVPLEQVVELSFRNGRVVYLSDLQPVRYRHTPYLRIGYPFRNDSTVLGNPMALRGQTFRKGLGMHSRAELAYALGRAYERFEAVMGIDDETAGQGSVVFRVLCDGQSAWESPALTGTSAPQPIRVALDGVQELTLVVDFADQGDVQDHADWAEARVIRPAGM